MAAKRVVVAAAVVAAIAGAPLVPAVVAAPEITIRAHTQLSFDGIRRGYDDGLVATGQLRDKLTGDPLGSQRIAVRIGGQTYLAFTDDTGKFTVQLPLLTGTQDLSLTFAGGAALDAADLDVHGVEVDKQPLDLAITTTPINGGVQTSVTATSFGNPVTVRVTIHAGGADADPGSLPVVGEVSSGGSLNVTRKQAGGAGRRRVRAEFAGDQVYAAAHVDTTFELKTATRTTFALSGSTVAYEDRVAGKGTVLDEDGKGVARAPVTLLTGDRRLEQTSTATDGTYHFSVEAKLLGQGAHALVVAVDTSSPFLSPSTADPVVVKIEAPHPVPIAFTAAAFAATALVAGGFFLARSRPWDRKRRQAPPVERPAATDDKGGVKGGLIPAKASLVSTLRRASDTGVSGTVRDAVRGRPVGGASIRLRLGAVGAIAGEHTTTSAADGEFAIEDLAPGEWKAKVTAPGHVAERFALTVPHRGELRGVRIDLVPVREQVFSMYKVAAQPLLPEARLWGVWSPRQIVDHVRRQRPSPALGKLTDFVEETYFSARIPDEDILPAAQGHVDHAVRERAARTAAV